MEQQQTRYRDIADLHEELLTLLLRRRKSKKDFTFLFAPDGPVKTDRKQQSNPSSRWEKGWWFFGNENWVNLYLTVSKNNDLNTPYQDNLQISLGMNGHLSLRYFSKSLWKDELQRHDLRSILDNLFFSLDLKDQFIPSKLPRENTFESPVSQYFYKEDLFRRLDQITETLPSYWGQDIKLVPEKIFLDQLSNVQSYRQQPIKSVRLTRLEVLEFEGIKRLVIEDLPKDSNWIILTGENGFGKTTLLQALAIGLYGNQEDRIIPEDKIAYIEAAFHVSGIKRSYTIQNQSSYPDLFIPLLSLACYGASRLSLQARESQNKSAKNNTATFNLFNDSGNLKNIEYELVLSYYKNMEKFRMLESMLKRIIPALARIEVNSKGDVVEYYEQEEGQADSHTYKPVPFNKLASGIRSLVAMAGDIYLRLSDAMEKMQEDPYTYPFQLMPQNSNYFRPEELWGIVIIDELDLHLHPKWQRKLPKMLSDVFPNVQFIASTHSPIPLLGIPTGSVILTVRRNTEEGITAERLDDSVDISTLLPNAILTSPIFGFDEMVAESHDSTQFIRTEDSYKEIEETMAEEEKISRYLDKEKMEELRKLFKKS